MLGLALNDAGVGLSLERSPHYGKGTPRVGLKGVAKKLFLQGQ